MNTDRLLVKALTVEDNPEWVEGYPVYITPSERLYIKDGQHNKRFGCGIEVQPNTLCQCTGLKDKEGDLIFEGDTLYHEGFGVWRIEWNRSEWTMRLNGGRMNVAANLQDVGDMTLTGENIHDINK